MLLVRLTVLWLPGDRPCHSLQCTGRRAPRRRA